MADLNTPYSVGNLTKSMVNNETYSDVCFLVGDEKKKIYASKAFLALASDVFKRYAKQFLVRIVFEKYCSLKMREAIF